MLYKSISINQSKHICIAPYVANESEALSPDRSIVSLDEDISYTILPFINDSIFAVSCV